MNKKFFISVLSASSLMLMSIVLINRSVIFFIEWKKREKELCQLEKEKKPLY